MTASHGPLLLPGADVRKVADDVVAALTGRYAVEPGAVRSVSRTPLDTADRRLAAKGLRLRLESSAGRPLLVLTRPDGSSLEADADGFTAPALLDAVPPGPLRDEVAKPMSVRALLAQAPEHRRVRPLTVRDGAGKLVVRVEVDAPDHGDATRVTVAPLRGYQADAQRVRSLLARLPGAAVAEPETPPTPAQPAAHTFVAGTSAPEAVAEVVAGYLAEMRANVDGVVNDIDTEFLHDFRVAVRRTRSTLKLSRPVLSPTTVARREGAAKRLGDLTTPLRDLDVHLLGMPTMRRWLVSADPDDLEPFERHLQRSRNAEHRRLVRAIRSDRTRRLLEDWTEELVGTAGEQERAVTAEQLSRRCISHAHKRVLKSGSAVRDDSPAELLHTVRKRCKELRYALEMFTPLHDEGVTKKAISDLKRLQDCLGRFQDAEVQQAAVRAFAAEMHASGSAPAPTLLAMGELVSHLETDQAAARHDFTAAFARFVRPRTTDRIQSLGTRGTS